MEKIGAQMGKRIGELRAAQGMTQAALAGRMTAALGKEVRPLTVTRIEGGKRPLPVDEVVVIAAVLGVDVAELLRTAGDPLPDMTEQRARIEYDNACDALRTAAGNRRAAEARWQAAHTELLRVYEAAELPEVSRFLLGCNDTIESVLGDDEEGDE